MSQFLIACILVIFKIKADPLQTTSLLGQCKKPIYFNLFLIYFYLFDRTCQALLCTCEISNSLLCVVYRPPECPEQSFKSCTSFISDYCDSVSNEFELNILGDFNFPRVNWS